MSLEERLYQHEQQDRIRYDVLAQDMAAIKVSLNALEDSVRLLKEKVLIGNGKDSVMQRLDRLEQLLNNKKHRFEFYLPLIVSVVSAFCALVALFK